MAILAKVKMFEKIKCYFKGHDYFDYATQGFLSCNRCGHIHVYRYEDQGTKCDTFASIERSESYPWQGSKIVTSVDHKEKKEKANLSKRRKNGRKRTIRKEAN